MRPPATPAQSAGALGMQHWASMLGARVLDQSPGADPNRLAEHWFLDAATYARDGDPVNARCAAERGIAELNLPATP